VAVNGRDRSNGRSVIDPAHGGPLPQATLPELVGRLINDVSDLADRQIELAKQEVSEAKDDAFSAAIKIGIGAGIAAAVGLLLMIWAWTAFIWFFNWVGARVLVEDTPLGPQPALAEAIGVVIAAVVAVWLDSKLWRPAGGWGRLFLVVATLLFILAGGFLGRAGLGWLLGLTAPIALALFAWDFLIWRGITQAKAIWPPLPRTQQTLKEDLEWVQHLRTPSAR